MYLLQVSSLRDFGILLLGFRELSGLSWWTRGSRFQVPKGRWSQRRRDIHNMCLTDNPPIDDDIE